MLERISFEETSDRLKIIIPIKRQVIYWTVYSILLAMWLYGSFWGSRQLFQFVRNGNYGFEGLYLFAYFVILIIIAIFWFYLGRMVWRRWQYHTATREILFFYLDKVIVRRPLSLLGSTDAYEREFVSRFQYDTKLNCAAFNYGTYRIPVGLSLDEATSKALIQEINSRCFAPSSLDDDDEDDD